MSWVKVSMAYGGTASRHQSDLITNGGHVLVATPGRLMDFVEKGIITFDDLKFLVLDEADRMLDMGFREVIDKICNHPTMNQDKVTLMFSATFPEAIQHMAGKYLKNYIFLTVGIVGGASADVEQEFLEVTKFKKRQTLTDILDQYVKNSDEDRILVFVETKRTADFLASLISDTKISTTSIHGDRLQREREEALRDFRAGKRKVLVATAVAARGLDIKGVTHVINYDLPKEIDEYVHRIGRTGRVGNRGKATSFYDPENDRALASDLVRILTQADQPIPAFLGSSGGSYGASDAFGGVDIRQPKEVGTPQNQDEDW
jgi:probable ATP-dependent RNA helicase DDX4